LIPDNLIMKFMPWRSTYLCELCLGKLDPIIMVFG